jgi:hypothetical protein
VSAQPRWNRCGKLSITVHNQFYGLPIEFKLNGFFYNKIAPLSIRMNDLLKSRDLLAILLPNFRFFDSMKAFTWSISEEAGNILTHFDTVDW